MLKRLIVVLGLAGLLAALALAWLWQTYQAFLAAPLNLDGDGVVYEVPMGASLASVATDLQRQGIVSDARMLRWLGRESGKAGQIKAGEYQLSPGLTPAAFLDLLVSGKAIQYSITLIEGWNFRELMAKVNAHPQLKHSLEGLSDAEIMDKLGRPGMHPEGRFFPDTYLFPRDTSDIELLSKAAIRMDQMLADAWSQRDADIPLKSADEALILASIVEKETGLASERGEISGVFSRRLKLGMLLQTDPTVIYGMGERFKGNITRKDLQEKTAYNTYVVAGLPPTPICMPGQDALLAAVKPSAGKSLYFVAKGDGSHQFSDNLEQHNAAVRKYQMRK